MSDKKKELPRDLRGLCGGMVEEADGSQRVLIFPVDSYDNVCAVVRDMERAIADPTTPLDYVASLRRQLVFVKKEQSDMKRRILDHFAPRPPSANHKDDTSGRVKIDHGAKSKVEKAIEDVKAGRYDRRKYSKTREALNLAMAHSRENGRMPSHGELKDFGFNDQQATDVGKWLAAQNQGGADPVFLPLHQPKRGRRPKK